MSIRKIIIINGPNIISLENYDGKSIVQIKEQCIKIGEQLEFEIDFYQFNSEGNIIDKIYGSLNHYDGLIINAGSYSYTSIAIMEALLILKIPSIEVNITNTLKKELSKQFSYISKAVNGSIFGFGSYGYTLALFALFEKIILKNKF